MTGGNHAMVASYRNLPNWQQKNADTHNRIDITGKLFMPNLQMTVR